MNLYMTKTYWATAASFEDEHHELSYIEYYLKFFNTMQKNSNIDIDIKATLQTKPCFFPSNLYGFGELYLFVTNKQDQNWAWCYLILTKIHIQTVSM